MEKNWFSIFLGAEFPAPISGHRREKLPVLGPAVSQSQQSQKKKTHQNNVSNLFKANSEDTRTTPSTSVVNEYC